MAFYELDRERILKRFRAAEPPSPGESETEGASSSPSKCRVLIADSHKQMRIAAADILTAKCNVEVIGFTSDGAQAIDDVFRTKPDILISEIALPVVDGIRVTRVLSNARTQTRIVILTGIVDVSFQRGAMEAGALGIRYQVADADGPSARNEGRPGRWNILFTIEDVVQSKASLPQNRNRRNVE